MSLWENFLNTQPDAKSADLKMIWIDTLYCYAALTAALYVLWGENCITSIPDLHSTFFIQFATVCLHILWNGLIVLINNWVSFFLNLFVLSIYTWEVITAQKVSFVKYLNSRGVKWYSGQVCFKISPI